MIDLYTWSTPNGRKVSIALEEMGLDYEVHPINIGKGEQFAPEFLAISPNNRIPAIVDRDTGLSLFESGAILIYLGEKTGRFLPSEGEAKWRMLEWLMWQMGGIGPMLGQTHHFTPFQPRQGGLCRGPVRKGGQAALWRARPAAGRGRVHGRRLFHCRHGDVSVDCPFRLAEHRHARVSQCAALVSCPGGARRGRARLPGAGWKI
jgi:glutathione S-transferase